MNKKIIGILICFLFIISAFKVSGIYISREKNLPNETNSSKIFNEIKETSNKILLFDGYIGNIHVKYWEHFIDEVYVKGDSILVHLDNKEEIMKYEKNWNNIDSELIEYNNVKLDIDNNNYKEKQLVFFPEKNDVDFYYNFNYEPDYPLICWEICFYNGSIFFYNLEGEKIGNAIPMPSKGFSMSGHNHLPGGSEDPWMKWRKNANIYFDKWCNTNVSISLPPASTVSSYVSDSSFDFFYEIAHGDYTRFRCVEYPSTEIYYHSTGSWNHCAQNDMSERQPMKFAFIGSCGGMDETGPGSFSDEFRKGQMKNTVTIGYTDMSTPAWYSSYSWQNIMFSKMDEKVTMYDAFLSACAQYPIFVDVCKFVGDENLTIEKSRNKNQIINWFPQLILDFYDFFEQIVKIKVI